MTKQEKIYFEELIKRRTAGADMLEEDFMSGVKDSVTEKYSDQAPFSHMKLHLFSSIMVHITFLFLTQLMNDKIKQMEN